MRRVAQFVLGVMVIGSTGQLMAAESSPRWWPFGKTDNAADASSAATTLSTQPSVGGQAISGAGTPTAQQMTTVYPQTAQGPPAKDPPTSLPVAKRWSLPPMHLPGFSSLRPPQLPRPNWGNDTPTNATRNRWYEDTTPARPSPWQAVKGGTARVRQGARNAWDKTVDVFTPRDEEGTRIARREEPQPSLWQRMFGEEEKPQPRTVTEWMAQERLDP